MKMENIPKFKIGEVVKIMDDYYETTKFIPQIITNIEKIGNKFYYDLTPKYSRWGEETLLKLSKKEQEDYIKKEVAEKL